MSFLGDIASGIGSVVSTVAHTVEGVASGVAGAAEGVLGEVGKVGLGVIGGIIKDPTELLNPFGVIKGAASTLIGDVLGGAQAQPKASFSDLVGHLSPGVFQSIGNAVSTTSSGGSIYDKIFAALAKLQGQLKDKADALGKVDGSDQAGQQKALFELQQVQNEMTQLSTAATNLLKTEHDTDMSIERNFA